MLGENSRFEPRPLDAADGKDLGVHGVPHVASHLHPDQEAHLLSGEEQPEVLRRAPFFSVIVNFKGDGLLLLTTILACR